jgi:hypothetical protein
MALRPGFKPLRFIAAEKTPAARRWLPTFPLAALAAFCLTCCTVEEKTVAPADGGPAVSTADQGGVKVTIGAPSRVQETVSPITSGKCAIDAMKVCQAYGQSTAGGGAAARTVSLRIPDGPAISIQCRYSSRDGELVSAKAADEAALSGDAEAFLAAHGFCGVP